MTPLEAAHRYLAAGLSVIPIRPDGSKAPALDEWKTLQQRQPTEEELQEWFGNGHSCGVGIVCGPVSRGLEVLDFETGTVFEEWRRTVEGLHPGLVDRLPRVRTPKGGVHLYLFHGTGATVSGNRKLAKDERGQTLIETRGTGGQVLAPGSPPSCHPTGRPYTWEVPLPGTEGLAS